MVVLAVSLVTLVAATILRRLIARPGGFSSGLLLSLPLLLPILAALVYQRAVLPEITVLQPAANAINARPDELLHLMFLSPDGETWIPYAFSGSAGAWVFLIGASVSSFMLVRRAAGTLILRRLIRRCEPISGSEGARITTLVAGLARGIGLRYRPEVLLLPEGVSGAFAVGGRRGRILVSRDLVGELEEDELAAVLAHEVAHLQARDVPVVFAAGVLRDFMAWNPFAHVALRRLLRDREYEADRRAAVLTGEPLALASGLLKVCELMRGQRNFTQRGALALIKPRSGVAKRVTHLLALADGRVSERPLSVGAYLAAACLVAVLGLQAGERLADHDSAFAFVFGAPDSAEGDWAPHVAAKREPVTTQQRKQQRKAELAGGKLEKLLKTPALRDSLSHNMGRMSKSLWRLARSLGVPLSEFRLQASPVPLFGRAGLGVYRIDEEALRPGPLGPK
ncbi:MAG: M56 family metallopeptidase [Actinomycetota bacterium]